MGTETWEGLLARWLKAAFPALAAHNHQMAKSDRGVMTLTIDVDEMQRMLAGTGVLLPPVWQPADEFLRIIKETPGTIGADSIERWERLLMVMDPRRDVAFFFGSKAPDASGTYFTRFLVTHDGSVPIN
jgi:hypothetical protein